MRTDPTGYEAGGSEEGVSREFVQRDSSSTVAVELQDLDFWPPLDSATLIEVRLPPERGVILIEGWRR